MERDRWYNDNLGRPPAEAVALMRDLKQPPPRVVLPVKPWTLELGFSGGGGIALTTSIDPIAGRLDTPCRIVGWSIVSVDNTSGSISFTIAKRALSSGWSTISASAPPSISSATAGESETLTGWTTDIAAGEWLRATISSVSSLKVVTLGLRLLPLL